MPLIRDARTLSNKAVVSLRTAMATFNSYSDDGRVCSVLLHSQHACEMLLKAVLIQNRIKVFDVESGRSLGFKRCLQICSEKFELTVGQAGIFRTIDALRDAEQHWFTVLEEDMLYLHTRGLITAFDAYIQQSLQIDLRSRIPARVLPVSTMPPGDFNFLVDREYRLIGDLLRPGNRRRDEARARIGALLAMEALAAEEVGVSERDINRIERAVRGGSNLADVFPRLGTIASTIEGEGPAITVHFTKRQGAPVRYVDGDDPEGAAAVRQVDLQKKFHIRARDLAAKLKMTEPRALALRRHLNIDDDPNCRHRFEFGKSKFDCFSDNAIRRMQEALEEGVDMEEVWIAHKPGGGRRAASVRQDR